WRALGREGPALPSTWPTRHLRAMEPEHISGRLGYYCFDAATPITAGTHRAAYAGAQVALSGAARIAAQEERAAFALCRPPGHHAASDLYGGYCFFNNAAIAAQALREAGAPHGPAPAPRHHHGERPPTIFY